MTRRQFRPCPPSRQLNEAFRKLRKELDLPGEYPAPALAEAEQAAGQPITADGLQDATDLELVTLDPPTSQDLDQAFHLSKTETGYRVYYAIADLGWLITPGGALDQEAQARGTTVYGPDERIPLHPQVLSEGIASLLPGQTRRAVLWELDLDQEGALTGTKVTRALVRSRKKLAYESLQADLDAGTADEMLELLPVIGKLRIAQEVARGGVSLQVPEQEVVPILGDGYDLTFRSTLPVEEWNAQLSLLTGIAAAEMMWQAKVGILRTLPQATKRDITRLRHTAKALRIDWPQDQSYPDLIHGLDAQNPTHAAFFNEATTLFRGAGYVTFNGTLPPLPDAVHGAIAAQYAHVTAPLRRLADRYALEICLAIHAGTAVPQWTLEALESLPEAMSRAARRTGQYESGCVNIIEAVILQDRVGEEFLATVVEADTEKARGEVVLKSPAVRARVDGKVQLGEEITVTLVTADVTERRVLFEPTHTPQQVIGRYQRAPRLKRFTWTGLGLGFVLGLIAGNIMTAGLENKSGGMFFAALAGASLGIGIGVGIGLVLEARARRRSTSYK